MEIAGELWGCYVPRTNVPKGYLGLAFIGSEEEARAYAQKQACAVNVRKISVMRNINYFEPCPKCGGKMWSLNHPDKVYCKDCNHIAYQWNDILGQMEKVN